MSRNIIGALTCGLYLLCFVAFLILTHKKTYREPDGSENRYAVRAPKEMLVVCLGAYAFTTALYVFFLVAFLHGNETVTTWHLVFTLVLAALLLFAALWYIRWVIAVYGDYMEIHVLFGKTKAVRFSEVRDIQVSARENREGVVLYDEYGRKLVFVDAVNENYEKFWASLKNFGKIF